MQEMIIKCVDNKVDCEVLSLIYGVRWSCAAWEEVE